jgi:alpha-galactosidase
MLLLAGIAMAADFDMGLLQARDAPENAFWMHKLDPGKMTIGLGAPQPDRNLSGKPITLKGVVYPHGLGVHAESEIGIDLKGVATRFVAMVGVDDETQGRGSVRFQIWVDDLDAFDSGVLRGNNDPKLVDIDLTGAKRMDVLVSDGGDGNASDLADWAGAMFFLAPGATEKPQAVLGFPDPAMPIASSAPAPEPQIHAPHITGATPGRPFLFQIPATGEPPLVYTADNLPEGLALDAQTGEISGALAADGTTEVTLRVTGPKGEDRRGLTIVGGKDKLALTPPMGWNSWFVWAGHVDDAKVRAAADAMVATGLAGHGYQYVVIDDTWQAPRKENGEIFGNERFPDMKALGDYVHDRGLKFGMYTSPGPGSCAGYPGSWQHEEQDAQTFAQWGVDFVKSDWCSYGYIVKGDSSLEAMKKPFGVFKSAMDKTGRDMVYSLCQYGMGEVWKWGAEVGGNLWRTTGDGGDVWGVMTQIGFGQDGLEQYAGPGRWNDADMIQAGLLGMSSKPRPSNLRPNEQITQMTLWSILAAPLMLSCDLTQLDQFTRDLLMNDEVLEVNQDRLGKAGRRYARDGQLEVWARELSDGTLAVGLFNRSRKNAPVTVQWSDLGLSGAQPVHELWQRKDLGVMENAHTAEVPRHGAVMLKVGQEEK